MNKQIMEMIESKLVSFSGLDGLTDDSSAGWLRTPGLLSLIKKNKQWIIKNMEREPTKPLLLSKNAVSIKIPHTLMMMESSV